MRFDDAAVDGQPKSRSRTPHAQAVLGPIELAKNLRQLIGLQTDAVVADSDFDHVAGLASFDRDRTAAKRESAGIVKEVRQHFEDSLDVSPNQRQPLRRLHIDWKALFFACGVNGATDERADIGRPQVQVTTAGLEALQRESVVDQACQPAAFASEPAGIELALLLGHIVGGDQVSEDDHAVQGSAERLAAERDDIVVLGLSD
jgi:hypothetical protein